MKPLPLVTIMIPTYGQERFIRDAAESALAQTYANLEVIVADDCSPDDTLGALKPLLHDQRLRYVRNERNLGRVGNYRHTLFARARGDWCLNLDGDDYLTDAGYISAALEVAQSDTDIVLVWGNVLVAWDGQTTAPLMNPRRGGPPLVMTGEELLSRHPPGVTRLSPPHMACLFRREAAQAADFYRDTSLYSDSESVYRIGVGHKVAIMDRVAGVWRQHGGNATHARVDVQAAAAKARAESLLDWARKNGALAGQDLVGLERRLAAGCAFAEMAHSIDGGSYARAVSVVLRHLIARPVVGFRAAWWLSAKTALFLIRRLLRLHGMGAIGRGLAHVAPVRLARSIEAWVWQPTAIEIVPQPLRLRPSMPSDGARPLAH